MIRKIIERLRLPFRKDRELRSALYRILGFYPRNIEYYKIAFAHKSQAFRDKRGQMLNNERLEFLGDAVLETVVSDILFHHFEKKHEGFLTATRSKIVQRESLNKLAKELGIDKLVQVSSRNTSHNSHIGGNAFEALMGAVYLDRGYKTCQRFIQRQILGRLMDLDGVANQEVNFKSKLLEWCQKNKLQNEFKIDIDDSDKQKEAIFHCTVVIEGLYFGQGTGYSKKEAQQAASKETLTHLRRNETLVDKIFRSKEKRTAMEANEMAVLPKIDEIERSIEEARAEKSTKPAQEPKRQKQEEAPKQPAKTQEQPVKNKEVQNKPKEEVSKPKEEVAKPKLDSVKPKEQKTVAPKELPKPVKEEVVKPKEEPVKPVVEAKKATAVALAEAAIAEAERKTSYLTVIPEPQAKNEEKTVVQEASVKQQPQTDVMPEKSKPQKSHKKKVSTFADYMPKDTEQATDAQPVASEPQMDKVSKRAAKRAKKLLLDETLVYVNAHESEVQPQLKEAEPKYANSQGEVQTEIQPITELLSPSEVLATETLETTSQGEETKKKRISKAERIRRSKERKLEAAKQEQAKKDAAEKAQAQKNSAEAETSPSETSESPVPVVPQRKKKQSGNSRTRRRKQAQLTKEAQGNEA